MRQDLRMDSDRCSPSWQMTLCEASRELWQQKLYATFKVESDTVESYLPLT